MRVGPVDLVLERGDRVALIGPDGAGKSTLLRLLAGLQEPTAGGVRIKEDAGVALMTQEVFGRPRPYPARRRARGARHGPGRRHAPHLRAGLDYEHCQAPLGRLSGGQRVHVRLLRVSVQQPDLLLLDEPTNYIDTHSAEVVQGEGFEALRRLRRGRDARPLLPGHVRNARFVELTPSGKNRVEEREGLAGRGRHFKGVFHRSSGVA